MPKISATNSKNLFILYFIKIFASGVLSVLILDALSSVIILKLDLSLQTAEYISIAIVLITALFTSFISIGGFKNNYLLMSLISVLPLAIFVFINFLINKSGSGIFIIKLAGIFICSALVALIKSAKKR